MGPVPTWFVRLAWVMAALLAVCVVLQYNDPDPIRWMAIYGAGAVISALLPRNRNYVWPGVVFGLAATAWAGYLIYRVWGVVSLSDFIGKMSEKGGAVEEEREAGGLLIEGIWLVAGSWFRSRRA